MNFPTNRYFILLCGSKFPCNTLSEIKAAAEQLKKFRIPETMILEGNPDTIDTWVESGTLLCSDGTTREDEI